jgi:hypothetical protein
MSGKEYNPPKPKPRAGPKLTRAKALDMLFKERSDWPKAKS